MLDMAFIILNYCLFGETIDCVRSISDNIDTDRFLIIIVDNDSPNLSGNRLRRYFKRNERVEVLINRQNLGFAKGNNVGIEHVRKRRGGARFICCLNNDVLIDQNNIYSVLHRISTMDGSIAVIGPRIYDSFYREYADCEGLQGINCYKRRLEQYKEAYNNPRIIESENPFRRFLLKNALFYDLNSIRRKTGKRISQMFSLPKNKMNYLKDIGCSEGPEDMTTGRYDIVLHGCCLFFTESCFEKLNGFDPSTFMYGEELILFADVINTGLHTFKSDNIHIRHLEKASTKAAFKNDHKKQKFKWQNEIKSMEVLIRKLEMNTRGGAS